jgi:hypothetical protein
MPEMISQTRAVRFKKNRRRQQRIRVVKVVQQDGRNEA